MVISDVIYIEHRGSFFFNNVCSLMSPRSSNLFYLFKLIFSRKLNASNYSEGVFFNDMSVNLVTGRIYGNLNK